MVWHRNAGQDPDEILQNRFTAYLLSAVQRRRAEYIDAKVRACQMSSLDEKICEDRKFDLDREALKSFPLFMELQNEKLFQSLSDLSERERYVFFNRALDEKTFDELGWELGLSYKGVAAIYYRTIQKVKKKMKGEMI